MSSLFEGLLEKPYRRLSGAFFRAAWDRRLWMILIAAIPAYFLIYGSMVSYGITNSDGLVEGLYYYNNADWASACGRFFTRYASALTGNVISPVLAAVEGILFLCCAVYLIVRMWNIQKLVWVVLTVLLLSGNLATISLCWFPHVFATYCLSVLLAVLYAYCIAQYSSPLAVILGAVSLALSLGIYQAYIGVAGACAVGCLILALADGRPFRYVRQLFIRFLAGGMGGGLLYLLLMKLDLWARHIAPADRTANVSLSDILRSFPGQTVKAYQTFLSVYFDFTLKRQWLYLLLFALFLIVILYWAIRYVREKKYGRLLLCMILLVVFPLAVNMITLIITQEKTRLLMCYSAFLIFPFAFAVLQRTKAGVWMSWTKLGCMVLTAAIFWTYVISANATAIVYNLCYRHCYFETSQMLSDVYDLADYQDGDRIILAGFRDYDDLRQAFPALFDYAVNVPENPVFWEDMNGIMNARKGYLLDYFGVNPGYVSSEEYTDLITSEKFESMPCWPSEGSVAKINGIAVVKISEDPPMP